MFIVNRNKIVRPIGFFLLIIFGIWRRGEGVAAGTQKPIVKWASCAVVGKNKA